MSTQRRRVLEGDGGKTEITDNGVYIEGLNGKFYTVDNWKGGSAANSVAVVSGDVKFRIALVESSSEMSLYINNGGKFERYMTSVTLSATALSDYDGAGNTAKMLKIESSTDYAAGYCDAFTFPDGKTKGFLPSVGQLYLAYQNKDAITAAMSACGGTDMYDYGYYWSSTFNRVDIQKNRRYCWVFYWDKAIVTPDGIISDNCVRPFADIS